MAAQETPAEASLVREEDRPTSSDDVRTFLAGQRTLLAWVRTALALMGFGFLVAKFGLFLRQLSAIEQLAEIKGSRFSLWMGMSLVLVGVVVNIYAAVRHAQLAAQFASRKHGRPAKPWFEISLSVALALIGVVMTVYLWVAGH